MIKSTVPKNKTLCFLCLREMRYVFVDFQKNGILKFFGRKTLCRLIIQTSIKFYERCIKIKFQLPLATAVLRNKNSYITQNEDTRFITIIIIGGEMTKNVKVCKLS